MRWLLGKEIAITRLKPKRPARQSGNSRLQQVFIGTYSALCLGAIGYLLVITNNVVTPQPVWAFSIKQIEKPSVKPKSQPKKPAPIQSIEPLLPTVMGRSMPTHVSIESVGINADISAIGLKNDGTLNVPSDPHQAGWYTASPTPGERGPSIIDGHIDNYIIGPAVFWRLGQVRPGDTVAVSRADGSVVRFAVTRVASYSQQQGIPDDVYANTDNAAIRLITCGGTFNKTTGHYSDNTVVYGDLI